MEDLSILEKTFHPANSVLEVGCGEGHLSKILADLFKKVTAVEKCSKKVEIAKQTLKEKSNVIIENCDFFCMTFPDSLFDAIVLKNTLHFFDDVPKVLREVDRIIKPGGHFYVITSSSIELQPKSLGEIYRRFLNETFSEQLENYWTKKTQENFHNFCDPSSGNPRPSPKYDLPAD